MSIQRTWKTGDQIEMALPMALRIEAMPDDPQLQAILYGPLVLAGDLGAEGLKDELIFGTNAPRMNNAGHIDVPGFQGGTSPDTWIKPGDGPLTFRTTGQRKDVALVPLNSLFGRRYSVYWKVS